MGGLFVILVFLFIKSTFVNMKRKLTPVHVAEIIKFFKEGRKPQHLAVDYGVDRTTIIYQLVKNGVMQGKQKYTPLAERPVGWVKPTLSESARNRPHVLARKHDKALYLWKDDDKNKPKSYADFYKRKFGKEYKPTVVHLYDDKIDEIKVGGVFNPSFEDER